MVKLVVIAEFLRRNFMLVTSLALLTGTGWVLFALTFALFRDTIGPTGISAAHAEYSESVYRRTTHRNEPGSYYWFRQRRLETYATPVEHAHNQ